MKLSVIFEYIDKATAPMTRTEKQFEGFRKTISQATAAMFKLNQSAEFMQRMGDNMGRLMQPGVEFEQSMADLSSITGIAGKDLQKLGGIARQTGVSSGLGASGAADAFALLASQIDVSKIGMNGLVELQGKTITLSQAAGMSMTDAAMAMAGTINQFGLQSDQAGRIINVLAAGSKYGAAEIADLSQSFKVVGAAAAAAGLSVESTAGAIEVLSKNNLKGSEAGTALRNIMLKMQTTLGVDFTKTSLSQALDDLKPKLRDVTYLNDVFGMENIAAAQFLIKNADAVKEMTDRVTGTNVATEQAAIRTNTWSQKIKVQTARFNDWMIGLQESCGGVMYAFQLLGQGSSMLLTFAPIGKMFIGVGQGAWGAGLSLVKFGRTLKMLALAKNTGSAVTYARAVASCGTMGKVAAAGIALWSKVTKMAALIQGGFVNMLQGIRTTMMTSVLPALSGVIAATWAWTVALLANPVTWIVLAIGALVAAVVVCWKKFAGFRAVILTIWDTVKGFGMAIFNYLVTPLKVAWKIFSGLGQAIYKLFTGDFKGAAEAFTGAFKEGFQEAAEGFKKTVNGVKDTVGGVSGNYEMHLTEERAKQAEYDREKSRKEAVTDIPEIEMPEDIFPERPVPEFIIPEAPEVKPVTIRDTENRKTKPDSGAARQSVTDPVLPVTTQIEVTAGRETQNQTPEVKVKTPEQPSPEFKIVEAPEVKRVTIRDTAGRMPEVNRGIPQQDIPEIKFPGGRETENRMPEAKAKMQQQPLPAFKIVEAPEIKRPYPVPDFEKQAARIAVQADNDNRQTTDNRKQDLKIEMNFQPVINISAEMTEKAKKDFLSVLKNFSEDVTKMVEEVQRKNGRSSYAIS